MEADGLKKHFLPEQIFKYCFLVSFIHRCSLVGELLISLTSLSKLCIAGIRVV